jgi:hypothetical protein
MARRVDVAALAVQLWVRPTSAPEYRTPSFLLNAPIVTPHRRRHSPRSTLLPAGLAGAALALVLLSDSPATAAAGGNDRQATCPEPSADLAAAEQRSCGEEVYVAQCAVCHEEEDGEGTELEPELLADYGNAFELWDYVVISMPEDDPGILSDGEYWGAVTYLLASRGLIDDSVVLGPETAESVEFQH